MLHCQQCERRCASGSAAMQLGCTRFGRKQMHGLHRLSVPEPQICSWRVDPAEKPDSLQALLTMPGCKIFVWATPSWMQRPSCQRFGPIHAAKASVQVSSITSVYRLRKVCKSRDYNNFEIQKRDLPRPKCQAWVPSRCSTDICISRC